MSLIGRISLSKNKHIKQAIWRGMKPSQVNTGHVHALILMLIASGILELYLGTNNQEKSTFSPLKSILIGLAKEYANVGDDVETLSCNIDSNWHGIPCDR